MTALYIIGLAAIVAMGLLGLWPARSAGKRSLIVAAFAVAVIAWIVGLSDLMGRPRPMGLTHAMSMAGTVLTSQLRENEAIYLYVLPDGTTEPLSLVLPWSTDVAKQLMEAQRGSGRDGRDGSARFTFERSWEQLPPIFYPMPQPKAPPKPAPPAPPIIFEQPEAMLREPRATDPSVS